MLLSPILADGETVLLAVSPCSETSLVKGVCAVDTISSFSLVIFVVLSNFDSVGVVSTFSDIVFVVSPLPELCSVDSLLK